MFLLLFLTGLEHRVSISVAMPHSTVIVGLVLGLQPRDEQEPCVGRGIFGSREVAREPVSWCLSESDLNLRRYWGGLPVFCWNQRMEKSPTL